MVDSKHHETPGMGVVVVVGSSLTPNGMGTDYATERLSMQALYIRRKSRETWALGAVASKMAYPKCEERWFTYAQLWRQLLSKGHCRPPVSQKAGTATEPMRLCAALAAKSTSGARSAYSLPRQPWPGLAEAGGVESVRYMSERFRATFRLRQRPNGQLTEWTDQRIVTAVI